MKEDKKEIAEIKANSAEEVIPEFDGREDVIEPLIDGTYKTTKGVKVWLSTSEIKKFMGEHDPVKYFKEGKVPVYIPKALGQLLGEERTETQVKNEVFNQFPDVLLFKHDLTNIYTLLIPKVLTEHEFENGDFTSRLIRYDTRSIPFNGGPGRPSGFEADFFKKESAKILVHLKKAAETRRAYLS